MSEDATQVVTRLHYTQQGMNSYCDIQLLTIDTHSLCTTMLTIHNTSVPMMIVETFSRLSLSLVLSKQLSPTIATTDPRWLEENSARKRVQSSRTGKRFASVFLNGRGDNSRIGRNVLPVECSHTVVNQHHTLVVEQTVEVVCPRAHVDRHKRRGRGHRTRSRATHQTSHTCRAGLRREEVDRRLARAGNQRVTRVTFQQRGPTACRQERRQSTCGTLEVVVAAAAHRRQRYVLVTIHIRVRATGADRHIERARQLRSGDRCGSGAVEGRGVAAHVEHAEQTKQRGGCLEGVGVVGREGGHRVLELREINERVVGQGTRREGQAEGSGVVAGGLHRARQ